MDPAQVDSIITTLSWIGGGIVLFLLILAIVGVWHFNKKKENKD